MSKNLTPGLADGKPSFTPRAAVRADLQISRTTEHRLLRGDPGFPQLVTIRPSLKVYATEEVEAYKRLLLERRKPAAEAA